MPPSSSLFPFRRPGGGLLLALLLLAGACGDGEPAGPGPAATIRLSAPATTLRALGESVEVTAVVLDGRGKEIQGAPLAWSSDAPGVLSVDGAGAVVALGNGKGSVGAVSGTASASLAFTVEQRAAELQAASGWDQEGVVGRPLESPVTLRLSDTRGNVVAGAPVTLSVTRGGGSVPSVEILSDSLGVAETPWTLGTDAALPQELTVLSGGVTRVVRAVARPDQPALLRSLGDLERRGLAGERLPDPIRVELLDRFGNPVPEVPVAWTVEEGEGTLEGIQDLTDPAGSAGGVWVLGGSVGRNRVTALVPGLPPVGFQGEGLPNGVISGTLSFPGGFLAPPGPLGPLAGPAGGPNGVAPPRGGLPSGGLMVEVGRGGVARVDTVPGAWLVRLRPEALGTAPGVAGFSLQAAAAVGAEIRREVAGLPGMQGRGEVAGVSPVLGVARVVTLPGAPPQALAEALLRDPRVASVEPSLRFFRGGQGGAVAEAPLVEGRFYPWQSWHYGLIGLPRGWEVSQGSPGVLVAVVDDGIRPEHPALGGNLTDDGYDFVSPGSFPRCTGGTVELSGDGTGYDPDPTTPQPYRLNSAGTCVVGTLPTGGHGLHVAGTIAATASGLVGVAPRVRIRPIRVLSTIGSGEIYDVAQGILYAAGLPADDGVGGVVQPPTRAAIINLSLGGPGTTTVLQEAVVRAAEAGSFLVAAAGNLGSSQPIYPAAYPQVVSVAAVGPSGARMGYSSFGPATELAAPGGDPFRGIGHLVWSSFWDFQDSVPLLAGTYGTSMAVPHVAGVAALLLSRQPGLTAGELRSILTTHALDLGPPGWDSRYGHGLVHAELALTRGAGLPSTLRVHLHDEATGARVASREVGPGNSFRFPGLDDGRYRVYAGGDDGGDGVTGRPGWLWGALGGAVTPVGVEVAGHGVYGASFPLGFPLAAGPAEVLEAAHELVVGGYSYGELETRQQRDLYRVRIGAPGSYRFETGGWFGLCGFGVEADTILELLDHQGFPLAENDDIDEAGWRFCSVIEATLEPGIYHLAVRGYGPGLYTLAVR